MKKKVLIPLMIGAIGCTPVPDSKKEIAEILQQEKYVNQEPKIVFSTTMFSDVQKKEIGLIIKNYFSYFNISNNQIIIDENFSEDKDGLSTFANTQPGIIYIHSNNLDTKNIENTIIHELFHAIKPKNATAILPYKLQDGYCIDGFHGLSILVSDDKNKTQFGIIEDAAAEACAVKYKKNYSVPNVYYANVGSLMLKIIVKGWITIDDLIQAQQTNDFYLFAGKILNKQATEKDVENLMQIFNDVYNTDQDLTNQKIQLIENLRKQ